MAQPGSKEKPWIKDPNDIDNFSVTWATWLNGDTLLDSDWFVVTGTVVIDTNVFSSTVATVTLSGGAEGEKCSLLNRVSTLAARQKDRTVYVKIKAQ